MPKINLMHVVLNLGVAGLERVVSELSLGMNRDIFNVEVCCFSALGYFSDILESKGVKVTLIKQNPYRFDPLHPWHVRGFLKQKNVHILHSHTGTFFFGAVSAALARVPAVFYTEHGRFIEDPFVRIVEDRIAVRFADKVIAVSPELRDRLINNVKFPPGKVNVVVNGVNMELFRPRPKSGIILKQLGIPLDSQVIGAVGRFEQVKDHLTLLKAFQILFRRLPDTFLLLVGDGSLRKSLTQFANSNVIEKRIIFAGERNDVPDLLNLMDIFVLPSLSEGTSVSLLEAMASGVVPVVTNVGGNPSIVDHQQNGLLVKPDNPHEMAEAINGLLVDEKARNLYSRNSIEKIKCNYSIDKTVETYTDMYLEVLGRKRKLDGLMTSIHSEYPHIFSRIIKRSNMSSGQLKYDGSDQ